MCCNGKTNELGDNRHVPNGRWWEPPLGGGRGKDWIEIFEEIESMGLDNGQWEDEGGREIIMMTWATGTMVVSAKRWSIGRKNTY